ncbi:MAG: hypothetical protein O2909_12530 [Chloroflexi bacterium]|nr:hypothetical protein [Chloroflexota bacterium]PKB57481.1 MAG: hypothetical protein BZY73_02980 [SAR202 cluster bacterium Casp-Chloro-G3]
MSAVEIIALIRDIIIIVASGVPIVILLGVGYVLLRLYPSIKRTTQNVEQSSSIIHNFVSQPLSLIGAVVELLNRGLGMLETFRKRERRNEDGED